jgi:hypothetical protein
MAQLVAPFYLVVRDSQFTIHTYGSHRIRLLLNQNHHALHIIQSALTLLIAITYNVISAQPNSNFTANTQLEYPD